MSAVIETPKSNVIPMPQTNERGLFSHPDCRFTLSGLEIRQGMPINDWIELGQMLKRCGDSVGIWRGDYINYGKNEYGKTKYEDAIALTGLKEQTLKNDVWISKAIPLSARADALTTRHYMHLAPLRNLNSIKQWIEKTLNGDKKRPWSASRLKKEIYKATNASVDNTARESKASATNNEPKEPPVLSLRACRFLDDYMGVLAKWAEKIPMDLPASEREALELMVYQHGADAKRLKERTRKADCDAILKVLRDTEDMAHLGEMDASDLYDWLIDLRHFMAVADYKDRLQYMNQDDVRKALLTDAGPGRQTGRKGALPWIVCKKWTKVRNLDLKEKEKRDKEEEKEDRY
jgi:hypothetical protein